MIVDDLRAFARECPDGAAVALMRDAADMIERMHKRKLSSGPSADEADEIVTELVKDAIFEAMDITDGLDVVSARRYAEAAIAELKRIGALKGRKAS